VTGLFANKSPSVMLEDIRKQFTSHKANKDHHPLHWGQFLDTAAQQAQVGLYGAVAACLAYTADQRENDPLAMASRADLVNYWNGRHGTTLAEEEADNNLRQNVRLAFMLLGVAIGHNFNDVTVSEVWAELKGRLLPTDGLWSDAKIPGAAQHPAEYSSAMILILLAVVRRVASGTSSDFAAFDLTRQEAGQKLQSAYLGDRKKARQYKVVVLIAIMLSLQKSADGKVKDELNDISLKNVDVRQRYTHFFDYQKRNNTQSRDYLILPVNLLGAFLLYGDELPARQYFYATRVLEAMTASLEKSSNQLFMEGERPSTLEQGIVVVGLEAWQRKKDWKGWKLWIPNLWWRLRQDHDFNFWWALFFLIPLYGPVAISASEEALTKYLTAQGTLLWLIPVIASLQLPKWALAGLALVAGAIAKPQDLARAFLGKKK
jgi:hypothetical protein